MTIPNKVKVGGLIFDVEIIDEIDDEKCAAFLDSQKLKIKIEKAAPTAMQHNFLHEIIHAINTELDDDIIEFLTMSLHQIIVDNPMIFKEVSYKK